MQPWAQDVLSLELVEMVSVEVVVQHDLDGLARGANVYMKTNIQNEPPPPK
jgi:hypothetical protein